MIYISYSIGPLVEHFILTLDSNYLGHLSYNNAFTHGNVNSLRVYNKPRLQFALFAASICALHHCPFNQKKMVRLGWVERYKFRNFSMEIICDKCFILARLCAKSIFILWFGRQEKYAVLFMCIITLVVNAVEWRLCSLYHT